jgi:hypothetical protein
MTETKIAKELMKGCKRFISWNIDEGDILCLNPILCPICHTKVFTQLEANKRFLPIFEKQEALMRDARDILLDLKSQGVITGGAERYFDDSVEELAKLISDLQQAIKILEGK